MMSGESKTDTMNMEIKSLVSLAIQNGLKESTVDILLSCGYDSLDAISAIIEEDIQQLDISMGQRSLLRRWVNALRENRSMATSASFRSPEGSVTSTERNVAISETEDTVKLGSKCISKSKVMDEHLVNEPNNGGTKGNNDPEEPSETTEAASKEIELAEQTQSVYHNDHNSEVVMVEGKKRYRPQIQIIDDDDNSDEDWPGCENSSNPPVLKRLLDIDEFGATSKHQSNDLNISIEESLPCADLTLKDKRDDTLAIGPKQLQNFGKATVVSNTSNCVIAEKLTIIKNEEQEKRPVNQRDIVAMQTKKIIKNHRREIFLRTKAFQNVLLILEDMHFVTISGIPGAGKTEMALHILDLKSKEGFEPFVLNSPQMWYNIVYPNRKQIILVDDIFGSYTFNSQKANEWLDQIDNIAKVTRESKGQLLIVFTTRNYILRDIHHKLDKGSMFKAHCIANLSDKENILSISEKLEMFKLYKEKYEFLISDEEIEDICCLHFTYGFPHSLKLFSSATSMREEGINFFQNPIQNLYRLIKCFEKEDKPKYCAFVMTSWADSFRISTLDDGKGRNEKVKLLLRLSGLPDNYPFKEIITAFKNLSGIYLKTVDGDEFMFNHETLKETTSYTVAENQPRIAIEEFDFDFIVARIRTALCKEKFLGKLYNIISKFHYKYLAERLLKECKSYPEKLNIIMSHQCWDDTQFLEEFEVKLSQKKEMPHFISFLKCVGTCDFPAIFWAIWHKKEEVIYTVNKKITVMSTDSRTLFNKQTISDALIAASYKGLSCDSLETIILLGANVNTKMTFYSQFEPDRVEYGADPTQFLLHVFDDKFGHHILYDQLTPIRAAIIGHQIETFKFLLKRGASLDESNKYGTSLVHVASKENQINIMSYMMGSIKNIKLKNLEDEEGRTPAHFAISAEVIEILDTYDKFMLLKTDIGGNAALHYWARHGFLKRESVLTIDIVKWVCQNKRAILNKRNLNGQTVLHCLVKSEANDYDVARCIEHLVTYGADVNAISNRGRTALHSASRAISRRERTASILIKYGIKINEFDIKGNTALYYALSMSNGVVDALIKCGADANIRNDKGLSLLHKAFLTGFIEKTTLLDDDSFQFQTAHDDGHMPRERERQAMEILLTNFGVAIDQQTYAGDTALHICVRESAENLDSLLKCGANPNIKNNDGITATMIAACKDVDVFRKMIEYGGNTALNDNTDQSILHMVLKNSTEANILKVTELLHETGQTLNTKDKNSITPLMLAFQKGLKAVSTVLIEQGYSLNDLSSDGESIPHFLFRNSSLTLQKCMDLMNLIAFTENDLNLQTKQGVTPLMIFCQNCPSTDLIGFLMSRGCALEIRDSREYSILHYLIMSKMKESDVMHLIKNFISASKNDILPMLMDVSLVCMAVEKKMNNVVEFIINKSINAKWELLSEMFLQVINSKLNTSSVQKILETIYKKTKRPEIFDLAMSSGLANYSDENYLLWLLQKGARICLFCGNKDESFIFSLIDSNIDDHKLDQMFNILLQHKATLTLLDKKGRNILQTAVCSKANHTDWTRTARVGFIEKCLRHGINVSHRDINGDTAAHLCVFYRKSNKDILQIMDLLMKYNADFDMPNVKEEMVIDTALRTEHVHFNVIVSLLKNSSFSINDIRKRNSSNFFKCLINSSTNKVYISSLLMDHVKENGADVQIFDGKTLLHIGCENCLLDLVVSAVFVCCLSGKHFYCRDYDGQSAYHAVCSSRKIQNERNKLWTIFIKDSPGDEDMFYTALNNAKEHEIGLQIIKFLVNFGLDPNLTNKEGNTALHLVAKSNFLPHFVCPAMLVLIQNGADVNIQNVNGVTPLMYALQGTCMEDRAVRVKILLENGALFNIKDNNSKSSDYYAVQGTKEIFKLIRSRRNLYFQSPFADYMYKTNFLRRSEADSLYCDDSD